MPHLSTAYIERCKYAASLHSFHFNVPGMLVSKDPENLIIYRMSDYYPDAYHAFNRTKKTEKEKLWENVYQNSQKLWYPCLEDAITIGAIEAQLLFPYKIYLEPDLSSDAPFESWVFNSLNESLNEVQEKFLDQKIRSLENVNRIEALIAALEFAECHICYDRTEGVVSARGHLWSRDLKSFDRQINENLYYKFINDDK